MTHDAAVRTGQIFLSYSHNDLNTCIALRSALEQAGVGVFREETRQFHREQSGKGVSRVLRGGSWDFNSRLCRAAYRYFITPDDRFNDVGFRVFRVVPIE